MRAEDRRQKGQVGGVEGAPSMLRSLGWFPSALRPRVSRNKVWVKGHVPEEFLAWVGMQRCHDADARAVLRECCFEARDRRG